MISRVCVDVSLISHIKEILETGWKRYAILCRLKNYLRFKPHLALVETGHYNAMIAHEMMLRHI